MKDEGSEAEVDFRCHGPDEENVHLFAKYTTILKVIYRIFCNWEQNKTFRNIFGYG